MTRYPYLKSNGGSYSSNPPFSPAYSSNMSQCLDPQLNQLYNEGDFWSTPFSDCKLNTCVNINGVLNVERYS